MYFLDLADERIRDFKAGWGAIGDSIVVVGGDGLWNCHVHTNDIGAAIEVALDLGGRPKAIRVTDLFEEVDEEHAKREAELAVTAHDAPVADVLPVVTTAVVAICSGDGLVELFAQLGVQGVVTGGQTMNPSTAELLEAVQRVNADQVVILPNNKNIIPVAEQVGALTDKTVVVVPTRSMPEALAALVVYDPDGRRRRHRAARWPRPPSPSSPARSPRRSATARARSGRSPRATGSAWCAATASPRSAIDRRRGVDGAARPDRRRRCRTRHHHHGQRRRSTRPPRPSEAWLRRPPRRRRGRGAPGRTAALPVPLRSRMTVTVASRDLAGIDVGRLKGVGDKKRASLAGIDVDNRPRPAHLLPPALGRSIERSAHRRSRSRRRGAGARHGSLGHQAHARAIAARW